MPNELGYFKVCLLTTILFSSPAAEAEIQREPRTSPFDSKVLGWNNAPPTQERMTENGERMVE
jgi:hypothetical protein